MWRRSCASIDIPVFSRGYMYEQQREGNHTSLPRVLFLVRRRPAKSLLTPILTYTLHTSRTLFIDFRCSDSKESRIVSLHIYSKYRNDNLPDLKICLTFFQRF